MCSIHCTRQGISCRSFKLIVLCVLGGARTTTRVLGGLYFHVVSIIQSLVTLGFVYLQIT